MLLAVSLLVGLAGISTAVGGIKDWSIVEMLRGNWGVSNSNKGEGTGNNPGDVQPGPGGGYVIPGNPNGSTGHPASYPGGLSPLKPLEPLV